MDSRTGSGRVAGRTTHLLDEECEHVLLGREHVEGHREEAAPHAMRTRFTPAQLVRPNSGHTRFARGLRPWTREKAFPWTRPTERRGLRGAARAHITVVEPKATKRCSACSSRARKAESRESSAPREVSTVDCSAGHTASACDRSIARSSLGASSSETSCHGGKHVRSRDDTLSGRRCGVGAGGCAASHLEPLLAKRAEAER